MNTDLEKKVIADNKRILVDGLNLWYRDFHALKDINLGIEKNIITAIIGPSGCGKSTLLRAFNRMNDLIEGVKTQGRILIDGDDILNPDMDLVGLRKKVGMVFQRPNPFPLTIFENVVFSVHIRNKTDKRELPQIVEKCLKDVLL